MSFKRIHQNRSEGLDGDVLERLLADVRGHLFSVQNWNVLAEKANLSYGTLAALAYGDTKSPHLRTVVKIMTALGKEHPILEAFKSEKSVSVRQAAARKGSRGRLKIKEERDKKIHPHRHRSSARRRPEQSAALH